MFSTIFCSAVFNEIFAHSKADSSQSHTTFCTVAPTNNPLFDFVSNLHFLVHPC